MPSLWVGASSAVPVSPSELALSGTTCLFAVRLALDIAKCAELLKKPRANFFRFNFAKRCTSSLLLLTWQHQKGGTTRGTVALFSLPGRAFRVPLPPETQRTRGTTRARGLPKQKEEARARRRAVLFRRRARPSPPHRACHFSLGLLSHTYTQRHFSRQNCIYDRSNRDPPMLHKIFLLTNMY